MTIYSSEFNSAYLLLNLLPILPLDGGQALVALLETKEIRNIVHEPQ